MKKIILASVITLLFSNNVYSAPIGVTPDTRPAAPQERKQWKEQGLSLQLSGAYLSGNVNFLNLSTLLSYNLNVGKNQFFIDGGNLFTQAGTTTVANRVNVSGLYAYNVLDNFNIYGYSTHTKDESNKIDYRLTNGIGVCLHKIIEPIFKLSLVSLGVSSENEWFQTKDSNFGVRSVLRTNFIYPINSNVDIGVDGFYTPMIYDFSDYRLYGEGFIKIKLDPEIASLKISVADEYDTKPQAGIKNNDFGVFATIGFDLGK
jgi:hypothetical protein